MSVEMLSWHLELPKSIKLILQLVAEIKLLSIDWPLKEEEKITNAKRDNKVLLSLEDEHVRESGAMTNKRLSLGQQGENRERSIIQTNQGPIMIMT